MECPNCKEELTQQTMKEKVKYKSVKMAININAHVCPECEEVFISEEDQAVYDSRVKNFRAKMDIEDKKVTKH